MPNYNTLRRINFAKEQHGFINAFMNTTPLFDFAPASPTNNGKMHKYGKIISIGQPVRRRVAGGYAEEDVKRISEQLQLVPFSYKYTMSNDLVNDLSVEQLMNHIMENEELIGNESAKSFEVEQYTKFLDFAKDNHRKDFYGTNLGAKLFDAGGTTDGEMYNIIFVAWKQGKINMLYNPAMNPMITNDVSIFRKDLVANGSLVEIGSYTEDSTLFKQYGKVMLYDTAIDSLLNDPRKITAIVNIPINVSSSDLRKLMEDALEACYPEDATAITMHYHNDLRKVINEIKTDKLEMRPEDKAFNTRYDVFNEAVLIKSRQMLKEQDVITVSDE
ncbi:MAG: hypothetical protein BV457_00150 [Thermoplasmata archaeon M9B1D]|nr:MAG: hypothetical protein BV457_00150 [Thermoplasmata archaeon M9B1D]PNX52224.1 MAG: hypothetical protein BV456_00145 [Thermoplasmata archaeon M8B2D]